MENKFLSRVRPALPGLIAEFMTVLLSVLIAFALNNWSANQKDRKLEQFYLSEFRKNLSSDLENLNGTIVDQTSRVGMLQEIIRVLPASGPADRTYIDSLFRAKVGNTTFFPIEGAYKSMVAEGSLDLISDKALLTAIVELYENYYQRIIYLGKVLDEQTEKSAWEEQKFFSFFHMKLQDWTDTRDKELLTLQEHRFIFIQLYLEFAHKTLAKIKDLQAALEQSQT